MGGFKEVGRSSMLLQTPNSRVLLDCGVNVAAPDNKTAFPYLNAPEFSIESSNSSSPPFLQDTAIVPSITRMRMKAKSLLNFLMVVSFLGLVYLF